MNSEFEQAIVLMEDTYAAHNFWKSQITKLYYNREIGTEFEREIVELCPEFKHLFERYESSLKREYKLFDLYGRWDHEDGNPIFYGFVPRTFRAVRIIQAPPQDTTNQLSAWVERSFTNFSKDIKAFDASGSYELVIYIELNSLTFRYASMLIYFWISRRAVRPRHEEKLIDRIYNLKIRGEHSLD